MDDVFTQILVGMFLLMLGGTCGWILSRITRLTDALSDTQRALAVALNDIAHLKEKAATHTNHIDTLFEMQKSIGVIQSEVEHLGKVLPQIMQIMGQLAGIAQKRMASAA